jgi:hypothetical protein
MAGLGFGITFFGYSVLYYGLTQVQGFNYGFLDLMVPKRWQAVETAPPKKDDGSTASTAKPSGSPVAKVLAPTNNAVANAAIDPVGSAAVKLWHLAFG